MKTKIFSLLTLIVVALGMTSCHEDLNGPTVSSKKGSVNLRSMGVEINNAEKVIASSRAGVDLSNYLIDIYNSEGVLQESWKYSEMPELFTLPVGTNYSVKVRSHEVQKAAWDAPYFVGEKTFDVTADDITEIGVVTCTLANVKVTIDYSDELKAVMGDDCVVTVTANDEGTLDFTKSETRAGYFEFVENSKTLTAVFTGTVQGNKETLKFLADDLEAGQYRKITFKLNGSDVEKPEESGTVTVSGINLSMAVETVNLGSSDLSVDEDILGDSDRPGQQDPEETETPDTGDNNNGGGDSNEDGDSAADAVTFTCSQGLSLTADNKVSDFPSGTSIQVIMDVPKGIKNLIVNVSSNCSEFNGLIEGMQFSPVDLANPNSTQIESCEGLGFPYGSAVVDKTSVTFDISQFIPMLSSFYGDGDVDGKFVFTFSVTDNDGNLVSKSLTFVTKK
jgi:hypothetical protein